MLLTWDLFLALPVGTAPEWGECRLLEAEPEGNTKCAARSKCFRACFFTSAAFSWCVMNAKSSDPFFWRVIWKTSSLFFFFLKSPDGPKQQGQNFAKRSVMGSSTATSTCVSKNTSFLGNAETATRDKSRAWSSEYENMKCGCSSHFHSTHSAASQAKRKLNTLWRGVVPLSYKRLKK